MKEEMVPSSETCKKLWDLGIQVETYFYWVDPFKCDYLPDGVPYLMIRYPHEKMGPGYRNFPAPTASEIGGLLPRNLHIDGIRYNLQIQKTESSWFVQYELYKAVIHKSLAEALAQMMIWLKENDLLRDKT